MSRDLYSPKMTGGANGRKKAHSGSAAEGNLLSIINKPVFTGYMDLKKKLRLRQIARFLRIQ